LIYKGYGVLDKKYRILVIDDNEEILVSLKSFLIKKGYEVVTASNGLDALKLLEAATVDFDLVVTDLVMPNISGVAVTAIIKKQNLKMPVIAITGYGEQPEALAREVHADVVMEKPFKLDALEDHISRLLIKIKS
jgi:DNA-binding NtrC family response regulator